MKKALFPISLAISFIPVSALAEEQTDLEPQEPTWADEQHQEVKNTLHNWANVIDSWIGETDPKNPASAGLRVMLDSEWNRYDDFSIKPRVRGKIRLPALKKHLSLVFGDEDLDNEERDKNRIGRNYDKPLKDNKKYDRQQSRNDNASIGLRWSNSIKQLGIDTDLDVGVRSGADVFVRFKAGKEWRLTDNITTRLEQIYRYGSNSKHYLRTNFENKYQESESVFFANHLHLQYTHDVDEETGWGNSLYRQHDFKNFKRLNYGIYVGGPLENKKFDVNQYGPFITWRQPILRKWLFIQPELNYYNNREENRKHSLGAFLRLEAIF